MNTKVIRLDINKRLYEVVTAKQGDTKSRFLLFNLFNNSLAVNLTNRSVRAYAIKPDGKEIYNDLIINDATKGICTLELTSQSLAVSGIVDMELVIFEVDKKLSSIPFKIEVIESINSEDAIVSTNEFTALLNALSKVQDIDNKFAAVNSSLETKANYKDIGNRVTSVYDTFNKADGKLVKSENGQTYLVAGDNEDVLFRVENKVAKLGDLGNAYISLRTTNDIETIGAEWLWNTGTTTSTIAFVITGDNNALDLANLCHFITNSKGWNLQFRVGASSNQLVTVMSGVYDKQLKLDGTVYRFEMTVDKANNSVYMRLPDGNIVSYQSDTYIPPTCKARAYWQIIRRNATDEEPCLTSIWLTEQIGRTIGSSKENSNIFPSLGKLKSESITNNVNKKIYSITPTTTGWHRILEATSDLLHGNVKIYTDGQYDSSVTDVDINFSVGAFNTDRTLTQLSHSGFNNGIISKIRTNDNGSNLLCLDIYIKSATSPKPIYFEFSGASLLKLLNSQVQTVFKGISNPAELSKAQELTLGKGLRTTDTVISKYKNNDYSIINANVTLTNLDSSCIVGDTTSTTVQITLPNSTSVGYRTYTISKLSTNANVLTVIGYFNDGTTTKTVDVTTPLRVVGNPSANGWILI